MNKTVLTWADVLAVTNQALDTMTPGATVWGVPRGGAHVAALMLQTGRVQPVEHWQDADYVIDDLIDSGRTRDSFDGGSGQFLALYDKQLHPALGWIEFPWEQSLQSDAEDTVARIIEQIGEDPTREGLQATPERVVRSWQELFSGYTEEPNMTWFADDTDEMVVVRNISYFSTCEHHLLPFYGTADVAYIPNGSIVGVSKIPRLVNRFARRLQIQERLARQVGEAFVNTEFPPLGVAVHVVGKHLCMMARGVRQTGAEMESNFLTGMFRTDPAARAEFFARIH